MAAARV